jgi:PAS domain S-box-containing protein
VASVRRRGGWPLAAAGVLMVGLLVSFGSSLHSSQQRARTAIERRFSERARLSAALTESLFAASATVAQTADTKLYAAPRISAATLGAQSAAGRLADLLLLGPDGRILVQSPGTPATVARLIATRPAFVRAVLGGQAYALSNVLRLAPGGAPTIQFALPLVTPHGRRVLVSGFSPMLLYGLIRGYLAEIPSAAGGRAYVLDDLGSVLGAAGGAAPPGLPVPEAGLAAAVDRAPAGAFAGGRYFAASPVRNSPWRVVLTTRAPALFAPVNGANKWVPWLLFAGFGLAATVAILLVGRVVRGAARLRLSQERFALAVEGANDGIWDRDFATDEVYFSPRWKAMLGHAEDEIGDLPREWQSRVHPDDVPGLQATMAAHLRGEATHFESEHRMRHRDGVYRWSSRAAWPSATLPADRRGWPARCPTSPPGRPPRRSCARARSTTPSPACPTGRSSSTG